MLSPRVQQIIRYIEWVFIATHLVMHVSSEQLSLSGLLFYSALILLSFVFPGERLHWQRQGYILLGVFLVVCANCMGTSLDLLLYLYVAKSCFLLNSYRVFLTIALAGVAWVVSEWFVATQTLLSTRFEPPYGYGTYTPSAIAFYALGIYVATSLFVGLFSTLVKAEHKSRQRAEALTQQVEILAADLERSRIARDIHDSLGHTLTNLDIQLEVAQRLRDRNIQQAFEAVDTAKVLAGQCIEDVSHAVATLRRSDFNLNHALSALIEQFRQQHSTRIQWDINLPTLPLQTSHQIYCIIKESLINAQKHAQASQIELRGQLITSAIVLEITDNGIGFDAESVRSGWGLKGIAERVQLLGGVLNIHSGSGRGTRVQVTLPL